VEECDWEACPSWRQRAQEDVVEQEEAKLRQWFAKWEEKAKSMWDTWLTYKVFDADISRPESKLNHGRYSDKHTGEFTRFPRILGGQYRRGSGVRISGTFRGLCLAVSPVVCEN